MARYNGIDLAKELKKALGGVLAGMSGKEKGKLVYFSMKTVASREARKVRKEVEQIGTTRGPKILISRGILKNAVWGYASAGKARAGVKMSPGKGMKTRKGVVPVRQDPDRKLPILLWAGYGTIERSTKKGYNRGKMDPGKYGLADKNITHEDEIRKKLPIEVDRRVNRWIAKELKK